MSLMVSLMTSGTELGQFLKIFIPTFKGGKDSAKLKVGVKLELFLYFYNANCFKGPLNQEQSVLRISCNMPTVFKQGISCNEIVILRYLETKR